VLSEFRPPRFTARYITGVELEGPECRFQHCLGLDTFSALPGTLSTECVDQAGFLWRQARPPARSHRPGREACSGNSPSCMC